MSDAPLVNPEKISQAFIGIATDTQRDGQGFSDRPATKRALAKIHDFLRANAILNKGERLLDIGMGGGQNCKSLADAFGIEAWGVTIDPDEIERAEAAGVQGRRADMHDLPFEDGFFDRIWASHVLEHSAGPLVALREWYRVLKPGGRMLIWGPVGRDFEGQDKGTAVYGCRDHLITPTEWQYRWMFKLTGLDVEHALDAPYHLASDWDDKWHRRKRALRAFLGRLGLAFLPSKDPETALFFVLRKPEAGA